MTVHVGTAGWSIPRAVADAFPGEGSHLARYARVFTVAEINSSFARTHKPDTYARWAAQVPSGFRFSVKLPRTLTHDLRLRGAREPLTRFLAEIAGLGDRLGPLLVQLPPSLPYEARPVGTFFRLLARLHDGPVVCEPRHASWFEPAADTFLAAAGVARVAADPARLPAAGEPGGCTEERLYWRWHGAPRMYWSAYEDPWLRERAAAVASGPATPDRWCIFDNTASGAAAADALRFAAMLG